MIHKLNIVTALELHKAAPRADVVNAACEFLLTRVYKGMQEESVFPGYTEAHILIERPFVFVQVNDSLLESVNLMQ